MECPQIKCSSLEEYFEQFDAKVVKNRIPITGSINLTHQCNLRCVHCYIVSPHTPMDSVANELSSTQWFKIIDEFTLAGCLKLLITGGEPLLRKDFSQVYILEASRRIGEISGFR